MANSADTSGQPLEIPEDLLQALSAVPDLEQMFLRYPPSHKKEYLKWIEEAKRPETRQRRIEQAVKQLQEKRR
jgi:uncharacterized protein YdeI (YjbR/CyaY-like superfamily)